MRREKSVCVCVCWWELYRRWKYLQVLMQHAVHEISVLRHGERAADNSGRLPGVLPLPVGRLAAGRVAHMPLTGVDQHRDTLPYC